MIKVVGYGVFPLTYTLKFTQVFKYETKQYFHNVVRRKNMDEDGKTVDGNETRTKQDENCVKKKRKCRY